MCVRAGDVAPRSPCRCMVCMATAAQQAAGVHGSQAFSAPRTPGRQGVVRRNSLSANQFYSDYGINLLSFHTFMGFSRQECWRGLPYPFPVDHVLPQDWKRSVFIPVPKKGNAKECSNYQTITLISHTSKVMLKILQARLQQFINLELPDVKTGF